MHKLTQLWQFTTNIYSGSPNVKERINIFGGIFLKVKQKNFGERDWLGLYISTQVSVSGLSKKW